MKRASGVLFLCTGNSARSILAEAYLNHHGRARYTAHSAGSHPAGRVNPFALEALERRGIGTAGLRSKSWDEFARPGSPAIDFIFTVCDNAAGEACPLWPGKPVSAHWGIADPAAVASTDKAMRAAFEKAFGELSARIDRFLELQVESMDPRELRLALNAIGESTVR